jgi:hypothetical protein
MGKTEDDLEELKRYVELWSESYDGGGTAIPNGFGINDAGHRQAIAQVAVVVRWRRI